MSYFRLVADVTGARLHQIYPTSVQNAGIIAERVCDAGGRTVSLVLRLVLLCVAPDSPRHGRWLGRAFLRAVRGLGRSGCRVRVPRDSSCLPARQGSVDIPDSL